MTILGNKCFKNVRQACLSNDTPEELSFLDHRLPSSSALHLAKRFVIGKHELDLHSLSLEFRDFKACSDTWLPLLDPMAAAAMAAAAMAAAAMRGLQREHSLLLLQ